LRRRREGKGKTRAVDDAGEDEKELPSTMSRRGGQGGSLTKGGELIDQLFNARGGRGLANFGKEGGRKKEKKRR